MQHCEVPEIPAKGEIEERLFIGHPSAGSSLR